MFQKVHKFNTTSSISISLLFSFVSKNETYLLHKTSVFIEKQTLVSVTIPRFPRKEKKLKSNNLLLHSTSFSSKKNIFPIKISCRKWKITVKYSTSTPWYGMLCCKDLIVEFVDCEGGNVTLSKSYNVWLQLIWIEIKNIFVRL